jgi:hypothetical protein
MKAIEMKSLRGDGEISNKLGRGGWRGVVMAASWKEEEGYVEGTRRRERNSLEMWSYKLGIFVTGHAYTC